MPICYKAAAIGQSLIDGQEVHNEKAPKPGKHDLKKYSRKVNPNINILKILILLLLLLLLLLPLFIFI